MKRGQNRRGTKPRSAIGKRGKRKALPQHTQLADEALHLTAHGMAHGKVRLEAQDGTTLLCARENAMGALDGDEVLAERIGRERVVVRAVLSRAHEEIIGVLCSERAEYWIEPMERHLPTQISVEDVRAAAEIAQPGDIVQTRVVRWGDAPGGLAVAVTARIGAFASAQAAIQALITAQHLPTTFDAAALAQADACKPADEVDDPTREDLRALLSFTIDGRDAKDFDDAVSLEPLDDGGTRLGVHIADVGAYVPQGSPLDQAAYARGTSVYFPGRVLPMLPEQLSNGVCSLRPQEDKLTLSALMDIDAAGRVVAYRLARTVTRSKARLIYDDVNALFAGDAPEALVPLRETLLAMRALSAKLRSRREAQGCIDFETEEPQFTLDAQGEPVDMARRARGDAEKMIEDFMLTANACVAQMARERGLPLLYRVHDKPDPDKLAAFADFLDGLGVNAKALRHDAAPGDLRAVLEATRERPEYGVIATMALRSMQKACYDPKPLGHYGLAMADYCHFTSPIRRYPDLVVSRAVSALLTGQRAPMTGEVLADAAARSSMCERAAVDAERAADKLMAARYMARHIGEVMAGTISGVTEWGVYVLLENGAEGFLPLRMLDDWFTYDERRMRLVGRRTDVVFSPGMPLRVRIHSVDWLQSHIDLCLADPILGSEKVK